MDAQAIPQNATLADLLEAGDQALALGEPRAAHEIWRAAAVANPYDERVWVSLLQILKDDEDRKVCLQNIISINPLNTDARRQLRLLVREERQREEAVVSSSAQMAVIKPLARPKAKSQTAPTPSLARSILAGIGLGLFAVLLGVAFSIIFYGGILPITMP